MAVELVRYQVEKPDGEYGDRVGQAEALDLIRGRLAPHQPGGFDVFEHNDPIRRDVATADVLVTLDRRFDQKRTGTVWQVREHDGDFSLRTRKVNIDLRVVDTAGNRKIDAIRAVAVALDFADGDAGTAVCKFTGTTSKLSQHNPWKAFHSRNLLPGANAIDLIHRSRQKMADGARYFVKQEGRFDVQNVIYWFPEDNRPSIWNPENGWHEYVIPPGGSDHRGHYHIDCRPQRGPDYQGAFDQPDC